MTTEERQANQRDRLDVYRAALAASGGPELDHEELWDRYRQSVVQPCLAALTTAGLGGLQSEEIALEGCAAPWPPSAISKPWHCYRNHCDADADELKASRKPQSDSMNRLAVGRSTLASARYALTAPILSPAASNCRT
jgi:hypothetical protein